MKIKEMADPTFDEIQQAMLEHTIELAFDLGWACRGAWKLEKELPLLGSDEYKKYRAETLSVWGLVEPLTPRHPSP